MIELLALTVPLEAFDEQKLESLMRKIPEALVSVEARTGFQKKIYSFPKTDDLGFKIECSADHYFGSAIPSKSSCTLSLLKEQNLLKDVELVKVSEESVVKSLRGAMSYLDDVKKVYSIERVYGMGLNGRYQENFRYVFTCAEKECQLAIATGQADD